MQKGLHLIIGNSGSGKSTVLYDSLLKEAQEHADQQYFLVVPEQFTMQAQRDIVERSQCHGTLNIDIVSFMRLGYRIFEELGTNLSMVLEDHGKSMLLRRVLGEVDEQLKIYRNMKDKMGFLDQVKSVLSEFYQYEVHGEELERMISSVEEGSVLQYKLKDLFLIYQQFSLALGQEYQVAEQLLDVFCEVAEQSRLLLDASFYFDGFTGFTPLQYRVISRLMEQGSHCYVTITMDETAFYRRKGRKDLFQLSRDTYQHLLTCYAKVVKEDHVDEKNGLERIFLWDKPVKRFVKTPDLEALEANLFRGQEKAYNGAVEHVRLWEAKSTRAEVNGVAARIRDLVDKEQYRYREIAVVSANEEEYGELCRRIFQQYEIPCFLDHNNRVMNHPYVEALRAALAIVCRGQQGYTYDRMMRYLNTGLAGITKEEAQILDNYVMATNTVGKKAWNEGFVRIPKSYWVRGKDAAIRQKQEKRREKLLLEVNTLRVRVMECLIPLQRAMEKNSKMKEKIQAIQNYMERMQYEKQLNQRSQQFRQQGEFVLAKTWEHIYDSILELLNKFSDILGEERELSNLELASILDAGLADLSIGTVPPTMDQVLVGDFMRTRLNQIKVLFVMGLNDTNVPSSHSSPNLLTDRDRMHLRECPVELAPDSVTAAYQEQFYLYLILTKPCDQLILSYSRMDCAATALRPAYLVNRVIEILPGIPKEVLETEVYLKTPATMYPYLIQGMKEFSKQNSNKEQDTFLTLYRLCREKPEYEPVLQKWRQGFYHTNLEKPLSMELALRLFGNRISLSVTRLEQYASCAFAHFLKYGLHLQEREEYRFESMDFGTILHKVTELFGSRVKQQQLSYETLSEEDILTLAEQCVTEALEEEGYDFTEDGARSQYMIHTIERMAKRTMKVLCHHLQLGNFVPEAFELTFGPQGDIEGPVYSLGDDFKESSGEFGELVLKGTIDRLDVFREDTPQGIPRVYLKIVDYKTGNASLDLTKVYYGLQIQLLTYMMVAKKYYPAEGERVAAAALYYHIQDPVMEHELTLYQTDAEEGERRREKVARDTVRSFAMNGLVSDDPAVLSNLERHEEGAYRYESVSVSFNKDGTLSKNSRCQSEEQISQLLYYTENKIQELGNQMVGGEVAVNPYEYKGKRPCMYCPYGSVCQFDLRNRQGLRILETKEENSFQGGEQ